MGTERGDRRRRLRWRVSYWIGRLWHAVFRWRIEGSLPDRASYVIIAAPHTSNWDMPHTLAAAYILGLRVAWLGKHTLFRFPYGGFMRWLGGIPVRRDAAHGMVEQAAARLRGPEPLVLAVPPAGTRGRAEYWRSGFYWIAVQAGVPIVCGALDYKTRVASVGEPFMPTGDIHADMEALRAFYADVEGKFPENMTRIRLREEDATESP